MPLTPPPEVPCDGTPTCPGTRHHAECDSPDPFPDEVGTQGIGPDTG